MPEAVLAGPNGQPAIDQTTGMPLTMEELLRRRGILGYKGVASPLNMDAVNAPVATPADTALADSANATSANSDGSNTAIGASPNTLDENGLPIGATAGTPALANEASVAGQPSDDASEDDWMKWAALAGGTAAALAALAAWRNRRNARAANPDAPTPDGVTRMGAGDPGYSINDTLTRVPSDTNGSNQVLGAIIDGKNVAKAGQIGAGPKALSGPQPVEDVSGSGSLTESVARQRGLPNDYEGPSRGPQTRLEYGARKQSYMREGTSNTDPILMRDRFSDLSPEERTLASELAGRLMAERESGRGKLRQPNGRTTVAKRNNRNNAVTNNPIRPPQATKEQTLTEAVAMVRKLREAGGRTVPGMLVPAVRRLGR